MSTIRTPAFLLLALLAAPLAAACAGNPGLKSPVQKVEGTEYYTTTGRAGKTGSFDFTKKMAWLSAVSELSRARSTEVYVRLTREQRADLDDLLKSDPGRARRDIEGLVDFIDEATSDAPLRNIHELRLLDDGDELALTLGIPTDTWRELVDEAAEEVERMLEGEVVDLESPRERRRR